jgi:rare lipoprotein A
MTKEFENAMQSGTAAEQHDMAPERCNHMVPGLVSAFQSFLKRVALRSLERMQEYAALGEATVIGTASTYNPYDEGNRADDFQTASGELYDPTAWTAAIQIKLRPYFGGVRYGRNYRPAYALVDNGERQLVVKINDVGPLKPGRVIDLNERSMRYFDPSLQRGLVQDVRVTLLPGDDWTTGPVGVEQPVSVASAQ